MSRRLDPSLIKMHIGVPVSVYGECSWLVPLSISEWFLRNNLRYPSYCGSTMSGDGYTDGVSNKIVSYVVYDVRPDDTTAFKIQHPKVSIYVAKQTHD
jgi:hypothetical protein